MALQSINNGCNYLFKRHCGWHWEYSGELKALSLPVDIKVCMHVATHLKIMSKE